MAQPVYTAGGLADGFAREGNGAAEAADAQAAAAAAVEHAARQAQVDRDDPIYQARACTCVGPHSKGGGLLMSALSILLPLCSPIKEEHPGCHFWSVRLYST